MRPRGEILVTAAALIVGLAIAVAIVVASSGGDDKTTARRSQQRFPSTSERAPEAEDHSLHGLRGADRAARRFLRGYLPLIYGKQGATTAAIAPVAPGLRAQLGTEGARIPPAQQAKTPHLAGLALIRSGGERVTATAQIKDSADPAHALVFTLEDTARRGWLVTRIGDRP